MHTTIPGDGRFSNEFKVERQERPQTDWNTHCIHQHCHLYHTHTDAQMHCARIATAAAAASTTTICVVYTMSVLHLHNTYNVLWLGGVVVRVKSSQVIFNDK